MAHIAVDMTPFLPGGENGGVKLLALELIKGFQAEAYRNRLLILTASWNHQELAFLDGPATRRLCVLDKKDPRVSPSLPVPPLIERGLRKMYRVLRRRVRDGLNRRGPLSAAAVDVLFCPFTAPSYAEPGVPVVSVVCDLQHREYPQFFSPEELDAREFFFSEVSRRADVVVCISQSTREAVLRHLGIEEGRTRAVPISIHSRLTALDPSRVSAHLRRRGVDGRPYMFYPANFWPHKNHALLIAAYGMYAARNPASALDLVFTGALDDRQRYLKDKIRRMQLEGRVHFLGYVAEEELTAVWEGCSFLIFPSLYEGFGIPVLEAMQFGKPVLCADGTSLPEVAGDAALYFDPRKPGEIVQCLERITGNDGLAADLVGRGYARLARFQPRDMVEKYLHCLEDVISSRRR